MHYCIYPPAPKPDGWEFNSRFLISKTNNLVNLIFLRAL